MLLDNLFSFLVFVMLLIFVTPTVLYMCIRVGSAAYFASYRDFIRTVEKDHS